MHGITDTDASCPPLIAALAGHGPTYLHIVFAGPGRPLLQRIRTDWNLEPPCSSLL
ncbi:hypothetical protein [Nonomuraea sp. NPDC049504]|uniref:hypothetical protein n=1 Tax=Nonomuraea sp. NPDC049504 TaxID=3154729 RepID=UPI003446533E